MTDYRHAFEQEFSNCKELMSDDFEREHFGPAFEAAAKMLNVKLEDLFAGNRHNTLELDKVYNDLASIEPIQTVEVDDQYKTKLYMYDYHDMRVVLESEYIGVFMVEEVALKVLEINKQYGLPH